MTASAAGNDTPAERRQHPRKNVIDSQLLTVALPGEDAAHRRGIVLDVSEGGLAVQPFLPLTPGSTSRIEFDLDGTTPFKGTGLVSWVGPAGRAGIRFVDLPPEARQQLQRFLGVDAPEAGNTEEADTSTAPSEAESRKLDLDGALELIAERARDITTAAGVAIALGDRLGMTCRVSKGLAPDVGAPLEPDAGLSGYCLRTGELVHCADTLKDSRINPAVAQQLNVRSILIVPVFSDGRIAGLLEVLSAHPHAFEPRHLVRLQRIAQLLSAAIEENFSQDPPSAKGSATEPDAPSTLPTVSLEHPDPPAEGTPAQELIPSHEPVNAADVAAPALSMGGEPQAPESTTVPEDVPDQPLQEGVPVQETAPEEAAGSVEAQVCVEATVQPATNVEQVETIEDQVASGPVAAHEMVPAPVSRAEARPELPAAPADCEPQLLELTPVVVQPAPPQAGETATAAAARRVHHIGPVYLTSATRLGGEVVLGATITTEGRLENIRVVSGPRFLGSAALSMAAQWHCRPYQLNGDPVEVETTITIHFAPAN